jgi:hypothetical protein
MAAADWFAPAAVAPAPPVRARPRTRPATRPAARRTAPARRVRGGIFWISAFAILLAGVVALNVAVLRANIGVSKLDKQELQLQADNAALSSHVSSAGASQRIDQAARSLGLVPASTADTGYIDLGH